MLMLLLLLLSQVIFKHPLMQLPLLPQPFLRLLVVLSHPLLLHPLCVLLPLLRQLLQSGCSTLLFQLEETLLCASLLLFLLLL